ncbi:MAG: TlpA family protein disulfide reductase [Flammeovirgaceae bacterium]|nr:TlpA family protein disulfide reductase [Flammeovirgaceae bacterium]
MISLFFILNFSREAFPQPIPKEDSSFVFLNTNENLSTEKLLDHFKGNYIYIDFWATWCAPCLEEFQCHTSLQKLAEKYSIVLLHISLDREKHEKKWKKRINEYNLTGYHIRADWKLQKDLWKVIFQQESRPSLPRFILIGKNGELINYHTSRPSEIEKLENEINQLAELK